jgi:hypothetical protein
MDSSLIRAPLPEELVGTNERDTACQYCGVSYLILNKMEQVKKQMQEMQCELDKYKVSTTCIHTYICTLKVSSLPSSL